MNFIVNREMDQNDPEMERDAIWLCDILDEIGISEKLRRFLQERAITEEILYTLKDSFAGRSSQYFFGSYVEGTYTKDMGSDKDALICQEFFPVIDLQSNIKLDSRGSLMVRDYDSPPGYVKLQVIKNGSLLLNKDVSNLDPMFVKNTAIDGKGRLVWTDVPGVTFNKFEIKNRLRQGPAWRTECKGYFHIDHVYAMRCKTWPDDANAWITRHREYNWPSEETIFHLKNMGCFLVKASHASSIEKDLDWRISFSLQERYLMCSMNDTQFKCYVVLKLLKKDLIETIVGESISSYHCKTSLFYTIEQNPLEIWKPQNLLYCVNLCLRFLLSCIKKQYCPNYFIPEENMFDGKVTDQNKRKIEVILTKKLLNKGRKMFLYVQTADMNRHLSNYENNPAYSYDTRSKHSVDENIKLFQTTTVEVLFPVLNRILFNCVKPKRHRMYDSYVTFIGQTIKDLTDHIRDFTEVDHVTEHTRDQTKEATSLIIPLLHTSLACIKASRAFFAENKSDQKKLFSDSKEHFQKGLSSDLTSCRLKYVALLLRLGDYSKCEEELISIKQDISQKHVIFMCGCRINEESHEFYVFNEKNLPHDVLRQNLSTSEIMHSSVSPCVIFLPTELPILPEALQYELYRCFANELCNDISLQKYWYQWAVIDSKMFLLFLMFLTFKKLNKSKEERMDIVKEMERLLNSTSVQGKLKHPETACNVMSWILWNENLIPDAMKYLFQSFKELASIEDSLKPESDLKVNYFHNAAKWHLLVILYRIWFSKELDVNFCFNCLQIQIEKLQICEVCKVAKYCSINCHENGSNSHYPYCKLHSFWLNKIRLPCKESLK